MKLLALLLSTQAFAFSGRKPVQPKPQEPVVVTPAKDLGVLLSIAGASKCMNVSWKDRGSAPKGYIKGMALAYAKALCRVKDKDSVAAVFTKAHGTTVKDALAWYGLAPTLKNLYTLHIGLGMREASGRYCEGRDRSATNTSSNSAEAGVFQTSYDSSGASSVLPSIMAYYQGNPAKCQLAVWKEGVSCSAKDLQNSGSGQGLAFQKLSKSCPAFATEWAAVVVRTLGGSKGHYGPIRRKEVQVNSSCGDMLSMIEREVAQSPGLCELL